MEAAHMTTTTQSPSAWGWLVKTFWAENEQGMFSECAAAFWKAPWAFSLVALQAGSVPLSVFWFVHYEMISLTAVPVHEWTVLHYVTMGGLVFSATSVWGWGRNFYTGLKAASWVVLLEGAMVFSATPWLRVLQLVLIISINMITAGCKSARKESAKKEREQASELQLKELRSQLEQELEAKASAEAQLAMANEQFERERAELVSHIEAQRSEYEESKAAAGGRKSSAQRSAKTTPANAAALAQPVFRVAGASHGDAVR
jgi:hypothetical protein